MARPTANGGDSAVSKNDQGVANRRGYWSDEINRANKRYGYFKRSGDRVIARYRLERENNAEVDLYQDRYNILYSSTETTRPSLYAQTPKVEATKRHKDRENDLVTYATLLIEAIGQYALEEVDFDGVMKNVIMDYLLPGMGQAWVRYQVRTSKQEGTDNETLDFEGLGVDYVHYSDFITGVGRVWLELPWIARRVYFTQKKAIARFGKEKAAQLQYSYRPHDDSVGGGSDKNGVSGGGNQAIIYEVWDRENKKVIWFSEDYAPDVLEEIDDPLHLKDFWPCPEPIRAVWTTRTFIPKSFYSEYRAQAEELDNLTSRIRYLTQAIRAVGVYDGSQEQLSNILTGHGNKLVPVQNWALFAQNGGIQGSIQWLPIKEVADVLANLLNQREIVKNEIYEITGFSDIVRGVSKASETLGAQKIKADWAGGRLKELQKEVQRFCRDVIRIMVEIMTEHFSETSLAEYSGFEPPEVTPEEQQAAAQYSAAAMAYPQQAQMALQQGQQPPPQPQKPPPTQRQQALDTFKKTVKLLKSEKQRCANIGIETDSTIMPDEAAERQDRMEFLGAAGAFLQQAGPMAMQFPDMRGLLGAIMMFTIRTFRSSRPLEKEFEDFTKKLQAAPPPQPQGEGQGDNGAAAAQATVQAKQMELQAQAASDAQESQLKKYEIDTKAQIEREKMQQEHEYRMAEIQVRQREVAIKEAELGLKGHEVQNDTMLAQQDQQHRHQMDAAGLMQQQEQQQQQQANEDRQFDAGREDADRQFEAAQNSSEGA